MAKTETTEMVISGIDKATIDRIVNFQDALNVASTSGLTQADMVYEASSYPILEDKDKLIGVPFIITQVKWGESKKYKDAEGTGRSFVILYVVTQNDEKWTVTDGSTGIAVQVADMVADRETRGIVPADQMFVVKNGLTRSDYDYIDPADGSVSEASTYYLA
jgi:hypothetical protein